MVNFDHSDSGTPEKIWEAANWPDHFGQLNLAGLERLVVIAAHPDDESLGVGGLIAHVAQLPLPIVVIVLSNGEASHPQSPTHDAARLAQIRRIEVTDALAHLAPNAQVHLLELPDGQLSEHVDIAEAAIAEAIGAAGDSTWIMAPWRADGHPDHAAASAAAERAARHGRARLFEYPIWAWHWSTPDAAVWSGETVRVFPLIAAERKSKARALALQRSQVGPLSDSPGDEAILSAGFRAHFARDFETLLEKKLPVATESLTERPRAPKPARGVTPAKADSNQSLTAPFFDDLYASGSDPWGFESRWYEKRKRAALIAALPRQRFGTALELGCSTGVLTAELADRCDSLLGIDVVEKPLGIARERLAGRSNVRFECRTLPGDWPDGEFGLIVLSEMGYYCSETDLRSLLERCRASLAPGGVLVACHWRHPVAEYPLTGDAVHAQLTHVVGLQRTVHHLERDFVLEVYEPRPALSVAQRDGLVP
ncbi:bifunctional PIG-L family deacetylase/class I SAM-dependent methyltransferase [Cryobacterium sp. Y11]|uniref:bifunctional PIG-L family deacetylase/class I SAM-dependent methyltransferase n=1 Tax=Cryobacterium sp. Y11 TaxID=2045016 RepID=UPI000CE47607|nr:bifunctional PIG-L family deacetylase/class I SAM-dependent methyltransferase [Cryobacterium sp. Y11]